MFGKVGEDLVDLGLVTAALGDRRLKVVGHQGLWYAAVEPQCVLGAADEVLQFLACTGLYISVLAAAEYTHEHLQFLQFTGLPVNDMEFLSREVYKELVAGLVLHVHYRRGLLAPFGVPILEL